MRPVSAATRSAGSSSTSQSGDATRLAYVEVLGDETAKTAIGFLGRAVRLFRRHGIRYERVLTDNGSAYRSAIHAIQPSPPARISAASRPPLGSPS
jgi:hypothetical protein